MRVGCTPNFQGDFCITECVLCLWMLEALGIQSPQLAVVECARNAHCSCNSSEGVLECRT